MQNHINRVGGVERVVDIGAGTGRISLALQSVGYDVTPVDIAANCLDDDVAEQMTVHVANIFEPAVDFGSYDYAICIDVLEHLPPERLVSALGNILLCAPAGILIPACFPSGFNDDHGGPLHTIVQPPEWWASQFDKIGFAPTRIINEAGRHLIYEYGG